MITGKFRRLMQTFNLIFACILLANAKNVHSCSLPPGMWLVPGAADTAVPYFNQYAYAYIGKVVGYSKNEWEDPTLDVQVLDSWTQNQKNGDVLKVTVQPFSGCGLPRRRSDFDPSKYPIGTRLRVISPNEVIAPWDAKIALVVLGSAP